MNLSFFFNKVKLLIIFLLLVNVFKSFGVRLMEKAQQQGNDQIEEIEKDAEMMDAASREKENVNKPDSEETLKGGPWEVIDTVLKKQVIQGLTLLKQGVEKAKWCDEKKRHLIFFKKRRISNKNVLRCFRETGNGVYFNTSSCGGVRNKSYICTKAYLEVRQGIGLYEAAVKTRDIRNEFGIGGKDQDNDLNSDPNEKSSTFDDESFEEENKFSNILQNEEKEEIIEEFTEICQDALSCSKFSDGTLNHIQSLGYVFTKTGNDISITTPEGLEIKSPFDEKSFIKAGFSKDDIEKANKETEGIDKKAKEYVLKNISSLGLGKLVGNFSQTDTKSHSSLENKNELISEKYIGLLTKKGSGFNSHSDVNSQTNNSRTIDYFSILKRNQFKESELRKKGKFTQRFRSKKYGKEFIGTSYDNIFHMVSESYQEVYNLK